MNRIKMNKITSEQIKNLFSLPLNELIFKAREIHKKNFEDGDVQLASLISIKTGSCPEDCKYCPQSAHYNVNLKKENLINVSEVKKAAKLAKQKVIDKYYPKYKQMGLAQRIKIDQLIQQKYSGMINKLTMKLARVVKKKEIEKVKKARMAKQNA